MNERVTEGDSRIAAGPGRPRLSCGNWGMVVLFLVLVGFVVWGVRLAMRPEPTPQVTEPVSSDAARAVALIEGVAGSYRDDADARLECLGALRVLPPDARATGLTECLRADGPEDPELRNTAAYFAAEFVADDSRLLEPLAQALEGGAELAAYALGRSPSPEAFGALSRAAHSQRADDVPRYAIWALALREEPEATDALLELVATTPNQLTGNAAAEALGYRRDPKAYRPLANLLQTIHRTEEPCTVGERAALALAHLGQDAAVKPLRDTAHRLGDYATSERLTLAFALCRLRSPDDYNFWILTKTARAKLPSAPYRTQKRDEFATAIYLLIQLDDERVRPALVAASETATGVQAECLLGAFWRLGVAPAYDPSRRAYVLRDLPEDKAPRHPPHVLVPPWPFPERTSPREGT